MGVNIGGLVQPSAVSLSGLAGKIIGVDGHNTAYQFLARIRQKGTGEPLRDREGRVTSHLSGIVYRTSNLVKVGIKPVFVWDGKPPKFKRKTIEARRRVRAEAKKRWVEAVEQGKPAMVHAQAASKLTWNMVEDAARLLEYMGIPSLTAPSEGEAQLAWMTAEGTIWGSASQDWDSLLFNSPRLIRNLSITGRRKLPRKPIYVTIRPEIVDLDRVLRNLGITREQLVVLGILVGTDYNPGFRGIGPKKALGLVKQHQTLHDVLGAIADAPDVDYEAIYQFFLNPPVSRVDNLTWKAPDAEKLMEFLVEEHDFSRDRIDRVLTALEARYVQQKAVRSLDSFFA
jgi:flap endonuclease-1